MHRGAALGDSIKYWVKPDIENRIKEGSIAARFDTRVVEIRPTDVVLDGPDGRVTEPARCSRCCSPAIDPTRRCSAMAGAEIDPELEAPVHDPETFETTVPGLYVAGAVVAGRQSGRIFIENGRFHGEVVIEAMAREDWNRLECSATAGCTEREFRLGMVDEPPEPTLLANPAETSGS